MQISYEGSQGCAYMKRIKVTGLGEDGLTRVQFTDIFHEIESYEERKVSKDSDVLAEHSFEILVEGGKDFANGLWLVVKGFVKMSGWAVITIVEGIRWLWKRGVGKEKEVKAGEKGAK